MSHKTNRFEKSGLSILILTKVSQNIGIMFFRRKTIRLCGFDFFFLFFFFFANVELQEVLALPQVNEKRRCPE